MEKVIKLQEEREALLSEGRKMVEASEKANKDFDSEERSRYDGIIAQVDSLTDRISRAIDLEERSKKFSEVNNKVDLSQPNAGEDSAQGLASDEYRTAFFKHIAGQPMSSKEERDLQIGTDAKGGYTVPTTMSNKLIEKIKLATPFITMTNTIYLEKSKALELPKQIATGADATQGTEISSIAEDTTSFFGQLILTPGYYDKLVKISKSLINESAIDIEGFVTDELAYAFARKLEKDCMTGAGTNNFPVGVYDTSHADCIPTSRDIEAAGATALVGDDFVNLFMSLPAQVRSTSTFLFHRNIVSALYKLKNTQGDYIFQNGLNGERDKLLGRPILESEWAPSALTAETYVGLFGDFKKYYVLIRKNLEIQRLNELFALTKQVGFTATFEASGKPASSEHFSRLILAAA